MSEFIRRNLIRMSKYGLIGLITASGMWLTLNLFLFLMEDTIIDQSLTFSVCFYVSAILWIYPSFWLNRNFTFQDKLLSGRKMKTTMMLIYTLYIISPLIASISTFGIQKLFLTQPLNDYIYTINFGTFNYELKYLSYILQFVGICISFGCNYLGQMLFIYKRSSKAISPTITPVLSPQSPFSSSE